MLGDQLVQSIQVPLLNRNTLTIPLLHGRGIITILNQEVTLISGPDEERAFAVCSEQSMLEDLLSNHKPALLKPLVDGPPGLCVVSANTLFKEKLENHSIGAIGRQRSEICNGVSDEGHREPTTLYKVEVRDA